MDESGVVTQNASRVTELTATQSRGFKKAVQWKISLDSEKARFTCLEDNLTFDIYKEGASSKIVFQSGTFGSSSNIVSVIYEKKGYALVLNSADKNALISWLPPKTAKDMVKELRGWGIGLIVMGIISLFLRDILDPVWGIVIIILGILNLIIRHRSMFIVNGIALIAVGVLNIISTVAALSGGSGNYFWPVFGVLQIGWGISEIRKFGKYPS